MFETSAGALSPIGAGVGLLAGLLITVYQIYQQPGSWRLMQCQPVATIPGWQSSRPSFSKSIRAWLGAAKAVVPMLGYTVG
jgi:hypothetical protein